MVSGCAFWISRQRAADDAFAVRAGDRGRQELRAGLQRRHDIVEHGLEDRRHAGHHMHVADPEPRRDRDRVVDVDCTDRHAGHALARIVELDAARRIACGEQRERLVVVVAGHAKRLGHRIRGDVVMRRPDAAGGEDVVVASAQCVDGRDDLVLLVGHDANLLQVDADRRHDVGEMPDVPVLGAAGQDFVADDDHCGGYDFGHAEDLLKPQ